MTHRAPLMHDLGGGLAPACATRCRDDFKPKYNYSCRFVSFRFLSFRFAKYSNPELGNRGTFLFLSQLIAEVVLLTGTRVS